MKRLLIFALIFPFIASAQTIKEGQSTLVYSLPKTELVIQASIERVTETPGEFYQYSERFLATSDVIATPRTYYRLKGLTVTPRTVPDKERTFTIVPSKKSLALLITVNEQGILCGINVPPVELQSAVPSLKKLSEKTNQPKKLLPLNEDEMMAGSMAKMAEGAAKQIYRIRENRIDLLSGDVEYVPLDGSSMRTMIEQMNEQEKELTQLFVGATSVEEFSQQIIYTPNAAVKEKVLFRFSSFEGIISAEDMSGSPYYLTVNYKPIETVTDDKKKKPKEEVFSVVPVMANIRIDNGEKNIFQQDITIPQLGVLLPLPLETMDKYSKAYVSPETGRLLSVEQTPKR